MGQFVNLLPTHLFPISNSPPQISFNFKRVALQTATAAVFVCLLSVYGNATNTQPVPNTANASYQEIVYFR